MSRVRNRFETLVSGPVMADSGGTVLSINSLRHASRPPEGLRRQERRRGVLLDCTAPIEF